MGLIRGERDQCMYYNQVAKGKVLFVSVTYICRRHFNIFKGSVGQVSFALRLKEERIQ